MCLSLLRRGALGGARGRSPRVTRAPRTIAAGARMKPLRRRLPAQRDPARQNRVYRIFNVDSPHRQQAGRPWICVRSTGRRWQLRRPSATCSRLVRQPASNNVIERTSNCNRLTKENEKLYAYVQATSLNFVDGDGEAKAPARRVFRARRRHLRHLAPGRPRFVALFMTHWGIWDDRQHGYGCDDRARLKTVVVRCLWSRCGL
jgi:hypothetical protein